MLAVAITDMYLPLYKYEFAEAVEDAPYILSAIVSIVVGGLLMRRKMVRLRSMRLVFFSSIIGVSCSLLILYITYVNSAFYADIEYYSPAVVGVFIYAITAIFAMIAQRARE